MVAVARVARGCATVFHWLPLSARRHCFPPSAASSYAVSRKMTAISPADQYIDVELLISEIEKRPCLWDTRITDYTNKPMKQQAWDEVTTIVTKNYDQLPPAKRKESELDLKRKWKGIRSSFSRELRKIKVSQPGVPRKAYVFFDHLNFLRPIATNKRTASKLEMDNEIAFDLEEKAYIDTSEEAYIPTTEDPYIDSEEDLNRPQESPRKRKHMTAKERLFENVRISLENSSNETQDEDRHFFLSLVPEIKKVQADQRMDCKLEIMSIIRQYQRNQQ